MALSQRGNRRMAPTLRSFLAVMAILGVASCGGVDRAPSGATDSPSSQAGAVFDASARAEVDHDAGTIRLPVEHYLLTVEETALLDSATALAMSRCATAAGVPTPWTMQTPDTTGDRRYGVWVEDLVARYGYDVPTEMPPPDAVDDTALSDADLAVYDSCNSSDPDVERFNYSRVEPSFDYQTEFQWITDHVFSSSNGKAILREWEDCIKEYGLSVDAEAGDPLYIAGTDTKRTEHNITVAVQDVACKSQVKLVQRLADLEAGYQVPKVKAHAKELEEMRAEYDAMLADARQYLAENAPAQ